MVMALAEKVDPKNSALIVIDAQNDYCSDGGALERSGRDLSMIKEIIPRLRQFIGAARRVNLSMIVYTKNVYGTRNSSYLTEAWREQALRRGRDPNEPFCMEGTWGCDFVDELRPLEHEKVFIKHTHNAFVGTEIDETFRREAVRTVILVGFTTNVCVDSTARDAFMRGYYVVVPKDCVATYSERLHQASLENIDTHFGQVVVSGQLLECWNISSKGF